jgi:putative transposase
MINIPSWNQYRHSLRLINYDYCLPGAYFVTVVSWQRVCLFGKCIDGEIRLNSTGNVVRSEWSRLASHFPNIRLDAFIIMPNHVHGIIIIESPTTVGATRPWDDETKDTLEPVDNESKNSDDGSPLPKIARPNGPIPGSLGAMIGQFKSRATRRIWALPGSDRRPIWQRNYYDHIIRSEKSLEKIQEYIINNPVLWVEDEYFSSH